MQEQITKMSFMKGFKRPQGITFEQSQNTPEHAQFIVQPFERGYGTTIGNTLRRILLSSIQGYAITCLRISVHGEDDNDHVLSSEFETIPHVVEDTLEVINNLKQIRISLPDDADQRTIKLSVAGAHEIKGADLEKQTGVVVANKDLHILTAMKKANFEIEMQIDLARGYVPAELNKKYIEEVNVIAIDAIFSPIERVKYSVESTRVGHRTDYDKLILDIWTDGTVTPADALSEASRIAKEHFMVFVNTDEGDSVFVENSGQDDEQVRKLLQTSVDELELTVRSSNCLKKANINNIGDLMAKTEEEIAQTRNFGKKSLQEIKEKLQAWNLHLGLTDYAQIKQALLNLPKRKLEQR